VKEKDGWKVNPLLEGKNLRSRMLHPSKLMGAQEGRNPCLLRHRERGVPPESHAETGRNDCQDDSCKGGLKRKKKKADLQEEGAKTGGEIRGTAVKKGSRGSFIMP